MSELRPLPIYAVDWKTVDMAAIKTAKTALTDIDFLVKPEPATTRTLDRVLAVGNKPWFLCDYALVSERTSPEGWQAALHWVLTDEEHPKATTILTTLASIFGPGTREIFPEELEAEKKLSAFLHERTV